MAWICTDDKQCANDGKCVDKNDPDGKSCQCAEGFIGARCDIKNVNNTSESSFSVCNTDGNDCQNGGTCIEAFEMIGGKNVEANYCRCAKGTFGAMCHGKEKDGGFDSNASSVTHVCAVDGNKCQNGGVCVHSNTGNYCQCPKGTSGTYCHGKNVCPLECEHGSSCRHKDEASPMLTGGSFSPSNFYCECVGGYKGLTCEIQFETCPKLKGEAAPLECYYGGKCEPPKSSETGYTCSCPSDRSGTNCELGFQSTINDYNGSCFDDNDCANGGLCVRDHDAETTAESGMLTKKTQCMCKFGWGGDKCESICQTLMCKHGGSCRFESAEDATHGNDAEAGAYCECKDGFKGKECEIQFQTCPGDNGRECLYGGACIGSQDDDFTRSTYNCMCPPGRKGDSCQLVDKDYDPMNPNSNVNKNTNNSSIKLPPSNSPSSSKGTTGTSTSDIMMAATITVAVALVLPLTLLYLRRRRLQNSAHSAEAMAGSLDDAFSGGDKETEGSSTNLNDSIEQDQDGEDIFDYDTQGVVDVNLDECEPVALSKDKQIV